MSVADFFSCWNWSAWIVVLDDGSVGATLSFVVDGIVWATVLFEAAIFFGGGYGP